MARNEVYTIDQVEPTRFICTKYPRHSPGFGDSGQYEITRGASGFMCGCFAGTKSTCRHREMVEIFTDSGRMNTGSIYDYDNKRWMIIKDKAPTE